jgi:hypothetical protein
LSEDGLDFTGQGFGVEGAASVTEGWTGGETNWAGISRPAIIVFAYDQFTGGMSEAIAGPIAE